MMVNQMMLNQKNKPLLLEWKLLSLSCSNFLPTVLVDVVVVALILTIQALNRL